MNCRPIQKKSVWSRACGAAALLSALWMPVAISATPGEQLRGLGAVVLAPDTGMPPPRQARIEMYFRENPDLWKTIGNPTDFSSETAKILTQEIEASGKGGAAAEARELATSIESLLRLATPELPSVELTESMRAHAVNALASEAFQTQLDRWIDGKKFSDSPAVEKFKGSSLFSGMQGIPPEQQAKLNAGISKYFDELPISAKRRIAADLLQLSEADSTNEMARLGVLVQNSGPAFQKLLQLLGNDVQDPGVKAVLKQLLSNVKPFPGALARAEIARQMGGAFDELIYAFNETPLASATIGQVHTARLKSTGEQVVIKVLRPGIEERFNSEMQQLRAIFGENPLFDRLLDQMEDTVRAEMDFGSERKNYLRGSVYQLPESGLGVAMPKTGLPESRGVLVLEMANGTSFKSVNPAIVPALDRKAALEALTRHWFENALFADGFFHADLHGGNFFFEHRPGQTPPYRLTLIDLGSAGRLTRAQQKGFLEFALGATTRDLEHIIAGLKQFARLTPEQERHLRQQLQSLLASTETRDFSETLGDILKSAIKLDIAVDPEVLLFNRGRMFLESAIRQLNRELPEPQRISMMKIYAKAALHGVHPADLDFVTRQDPARVWTVLSPKIRSHAKARARCLVDELRRLVR